MVPKSLVFPLLHLIKDNPLSPGHHPHLLKSKENKPNLINLQRNATEKNFLKKNTFFSVFLSDAQSPTRAALTIQLPLCVINILTSKASLPQVYLFS